MILAIIDAINPRKLRDANISLLTAPNTKKLNGCDTFVSSCLSAQSFPPSLLLISKIDEQSTPHVTIENGMDCCSITEEIQRVKRRTVEPRIILFAEKNTKKTDDLKKEREVNGKENFTEFPIGGLGLSESTMIREGEKDVGIGISLSLEASVAAAICQSNTEVHTSDFGVTKIINIHSLTSNEAKKMETRKQSRNLGRIALLERIRLVETSHQETASNIAQKLTKLTTMSDTDDLLSEYSIHDKHEVEKEEGMMTKAFEGHWSLAQLIKRTVHASNTRRRWKIGNQNCEVCIGDSIQDSLSSSGKSQSAINSHDEDDVGGTYRGNNTNDTKYTESINGNSYQKSSVNICNTHISKRSGEWEEGNSQQLYGLLKMTYPSPKEPHCSSCSYCEVSVLGLDLMMEERVESISDELKKDHSNRNNFSADVMREMEMEKIHYVIRVSLRSSECVEAGVELFGIPIVETPTKRDDSLVNDSPNSFSKWPKPYSRQVFTIRRDLNFLSAFHVQLSTLLLSYQGDEFSEASLVPPSPFDPFLIGSFEEGLTKSTALKRKAKGFQKKKGGQHAFAYSKSMHPQRSAGRGRESFDSPSHMEGLDAAVEEIEKYLRRVFTMLAAIDENPIFHQQEQEQSLEKVFIDLREQPWEHGNDGGERASPLNAKEDNGTTFLYKLGRLVGTLLTSIELTKVKTPTSTSFLLRDRENEPCWQRFVSNGLSTHLTFLDHGDDRFSLRTDEDLLKSQRGRCIGCGEPLNARWGFLGLDRNYRPCRYYRALFCLKWCHADQMRKIPKLMFKSWDHKLHKVSRQAADYLDRLWNKPVFFLQTVSPLLYEELLELRLVRNVRKKTIDIIDYHLRSHRQDVTEEWASRVKKAVGTTFGIDKAYLCLTYDLYSLSDLSEVQSGKLLTSLERFIDMLRKIALHD